MVVPLVSRWRRVDPLRLSEEVRLVEVPLLGATLQAGEDLVCPPFPKLYKECILTSMIGGSTQKKRSLNV